jgi:hypothetical protein
MASEITYDRLFTDIVEAVKKGIADESVSKLVERSRTAIRNDYSGINRLVKTVYMADPDGFLDRHKCGACFMVAFMRSLIIQSDQKKYEEYREKLAIIAGLTVMGTFIMGDSGNHNNAGIIAFLTLNKGFVFPDLLCDTEPYDRNWAFELRMDYYGGRLSVLSLAHELFLLESYNRALASV